MTGKLGWRVGASALVLFFAAWAIKCYGGSSYDRGRREAEIAHSDSARVWVARGADSVSRLADKTVTELVRLNDSLRTAAAVATDNARDALARERQAKELLDHVPKEVIERTDPRVRAALDSIVDSNGRLHVALVAVTEQADLLSERLAADSVAMRRLQEARDRWKMAYDTASTEVRQLRNVKTPKGPRFGFKSGLAAGIALVVGVLLAAGHIGH